MTDKTKPMTVGELICERIIKLGISNRILIEKMSSGDVDYFNWSKGRMDQIEDEFYFLQQLKKAIA